MILLLGATGYCGRAFAGQLRARGSRFIPLSRETFDYSNFDLLFDYVRRMQPELVINTVEYTGRPNVDAGEEQRQQVFVVNTVLPQTISRVCLLTNTPWAHVSSGCIYSGAKVLHQDQMRIEKDLNRPELRRLFDEEPERFLGFTELDEPNFSFRSDSSNVCSGTKVLAEESLRAHGNCYIWRPRIPFNEKDESANLISKLLRYPKIYDSINSLSHLEDCVRACLDLWDMRAPFGIYNVTNPGALTTRYVVQMIQRVLKPDRFFEYWIDDEEFYRAGARAPRSSCILDVSKLLSTGVKLRPVEDALMDSLRKWKPASPEEFNGNSALHDADENQRAWNAAQSPTA